MKSILMTTSAVLLVTGAAVGSAEAACPEDIDAFNRQYEKALQSADAGQALSASEQAELFGLKTAAENLHAAGDADMCAEVIDRANAILESAIAPQVIRPDELIGREVTNAAEEKLGEVDQLMLDPVSGRIAYVLIEHGGFLGIGDDLFAVPWRALSFVPGEESKVILDIPEERLENAPRFSPEDETPLERREWVTSVHNYYGVEPYWQDDVRSAVAQYGRTAQQSEGAGTPTQADVIVIPAEQAAEPQTGAPAEGTSGAAPGDGGAQPQTQEPEPATEPKTENETGTGGTGTQGMLQPAEETTAQGDAAPLGDSRWGTEPGIGEAVTGVQAGEHLEPEAGPAEGDTGSVALAQTQPQAEPQSGTGAEQQPATEPPAGSGAEVAALTERVEQLESEIQTLSEQGAGEQVAQLEERVQALAEQVESEVMERLARLEDQVGELSDGQADGATAAAGAGDAQQIQPAEQGDQIGDQAAGQQTAGGQEAQPGQAAPAEMQGAQQRDQQSDQGAAGQQAAGGQEAEPGQAGSDDVTITAVPGDGGAASHGAPGEAQQQEERGGASDASQQQRAAGGGAGGGAGQPDEQSAALGQAEGGLSCEAGIELIQEDLERAEELGIVIQDAWNDLRDAEANAGSSEALCRAAIKRAHEGMLAAGFEATPIE